MSNEVTTNNNVAKDNKEKKPSFFKKMAKFFKEMKSEAKKVVWPNKDQVINNTAVAVAAIVIVDVLVGGLDAVFSWVRNLIINIL